MEAAPFSVPELNRTEEKVVVLQRFQELNWIPGIDCAVDLSVQHAYTMHMLYILYIAHMRIKQ